jgi:FkbM family methyltransferase
MIKRPRRNVVIPTEFGSIIVNRFDFAPTFPGVGSTLLDSGTFASEEMQLLRSLVHSLPDAPLLLDIGANIGITSLVMAEACLPKNGSVIAFEPQRIVFQMLCGNLALNSIDNVIAHNAAVGDYDGLIEIPSLSYYQPASFGSLELGNQQNESIGQVPQKVAGAERVSIAKIDSLGLPKLNLIKVDVEGMELPVLRGAQQTFNKYRPIVLIEWLKTGQDALNTWFLENRYRVTTIGQNLICIPEESPLQITVT